MRTRLSIALIIKTPVVFFSLKEYKRLIYLKEAEFQRQIKCWGKLKQTKESNFKFKKKLS